MYINKKDADAEDHFHSMAKTSQVGFSYPPNLVHIWILIGANKIEFIAVREVRPNLTRCLIKIYKGFSKFIKGKLFRMRF